MQSSVFWRTARNRDFFEGEVISALAEWRDQSRLSRRQRGPRKEGLTRIEFGTTLGEVDKAAREF